MADKIRAARLDERGVYQGIDELDSTDELTDRHVPEITQCDLAPGKYRWDGKTFVPIFAQQLIDEAGRELLHDIERLAENAVRLAKAHLGEPNEVGISAGEVLAIVRRRYPELFKRTQVNSRREGRESGLFYLGDQR